MEEQEPGEISRLLGDAWDFKHFTMSMQLRSRLLVKKQNTPSAQREALLHLVFPDTFEAILGGGKQSIAEAQGFSHFVTEATADVDRKIQQIRNGLEAKLGRDFDFYQPDVRNLWDESVNEPQPLSPEVGPPPPNGLHSLAQDLTLPIEFLEEIETLLHDKLQVIFQGPPGTGKTYVAQKLAKHLAGSEDRVTLVQFHPSYSYEDFVQGFRPTLDDGQPGFELRDGPLRKAAERARQEHRPNTSWS